MVRAPRRQRRRGPRCARDAYARGERPFHEAREVVAGMLAGEMQPACDALLSSGPTVVTWPGAGKELPARVQGAAGESMNRPLTKACSRPG